MLPLLEKVARSGKPLLIIAEDVEGEGCTDAIRGRVGQIDETTSDYDREKLQERLA